MRAQDTVFSQQCLNFSPIFDLVVPLPDCVDDLNIAKITPLAVMQKYIVMLIFICSRKDIQEVTVLCSGLLRAYQKVCEIK